MTAAGAYAVEWTASARRALISLPQKVATAAIELIYSTVAENPHRAGRPLRFELEGLWSARRGDYRVIYHVNELERLVAVVTISHRSDVYRRRG